MPQYAATTLPTRTNPTPVNIASGRTSTLSDARRKLTLALVGSGVPNQWAARVSNTAGSTWTDFPEVGVTALIAED